MVEFISFFRFSVYCQNSMKNSKDTQWNQSIKYVNQLNFKNGIIEIRTWDGTAAKHITDESTKLIDDIF